MSVLLMLMLMAGGPNLPSLPMRKRIDYYSRVTSGAAVYEQRSSSIPGAPCTYCLDFSCMGSMGSSASPTPMRCFR